MSCVELFSPRTGEHDGGVHSVPGTSRCGAVKRPSVPPLSPSHASYISAHLARLPSSCEDTVSLPSPWVGGRVSAADAACLVFGAASCYIILLTQSCTVLLLLLLLRLLPHSHCSAVKTASRLAHNAAFAAAAAAAAAAAEAALSLSRTHTPRHARTPPVLTSHRGFHYEIHAEALVGLWAAAAAACACRSRTDVLFGPLRRRRPECESVEDLRGNSPGPRQYMH